MPTLVLETDVDAPPRRVFDLARNVDLHTDGMDDHDERAVAGVTSGVLGEGDRVTWRARHFGLPLRMTVEVTAFDRPRQFRDELVSGPFAAMRHDHEFEPVGDGTRLSDTFSFASPLGPLGSAVDALLLRRYMRRLLRTRLDHLKQVAETDEWRRYVDATR